MYVYDFKVSRPLHDCLQPSFEPPGGLQSKTAVLRHQLRRPSPQPPLQPHPSGLHDRYFGCLRECLHHHAQPQPHVVQKAGDFFVESPIISRCHHLVPAHLRGRQVLHFSPCHRTAQPPLRGCVSHSDELSRTGELPFPLHGRLAGRSDGTVAGTDCQCEDSALSHDFATALLGDVGQRVYARHQQPRRAEDSLRGNNPDRPEHLRAALGSTTPAS